VVVASGPSAQAAPIEKGKGLAHFIAVNRSIELCPWADAWYACDYNFWEKAKGGQEFKGLKMSIDVRACSTWEGIKHIDCRKVTDIANLEQVNSVGWGGNSGFHALQIAVKAGCSKVLLVGLDASVEHGLHWHGSHPDGMANPRRGTVARWVRAIDGAAPRIKEMGVRVFNCSSISALRAYPKMLFEEALAA
jgi:hypothetical protein